ALAAGPAAGIQGGPILLVQKGAVPSPTRTEIERLTGNSCSAIPPAGALTFTVAGDVGASDAATATLGLIADLAPFAHFVTGDLSYNELKPESGWCGYVRGIVGPSLPFELISGNHEDDGAGAEIRNFTKCLPDRLGAVGDYGVQYYTRLAGRVRIIAISPDLTVDGTAYTYKPGTSERTWLESAVAGARAQGEWVVIMHHKVCINAGEKSCNIGEELANWEAANADVVVMAHSHTYQRSYQLSCVNAGTVTKSCIADKDGDHQQGNGAVFVINGVGGKGNRPVNRSDSEAGYFAALLGTGDKDNGHGVMQFSVSPTTLTGTFIGSDTSFTDSFTIRR
ncbi:MAG: metallophosphoesterase, partial [Pirellulales bacterium]